MDTPKKKIEKYIKSLHDIGNGKSKKCKEPDATSSIASFSEIRIKHFIDRDYVFLDRNKNINTEEKFILGGNYNKFIEKDARYDEKKCNAPRVSIVSEISKMLKGDTDIALTEHSEYWIDTLYVDGEEVGSLKSLINSDKITVDTLDEDILEDTDMDYIGNMFHFAYDTITEDLHPMFSREAHKKMLLDGGNGGSFWGEAGEKYIYWEKLWIEKEFRGKGYAQILMRNAIYRENGNMGIQLMATPDGYIDEKEENRDNKKLEKLVRFYLRLFKGAKMECSVIENGEGIMNCIIARPKKWHIPFLDEEPES